MHSTSTTYFLFVTFVLLAYWLVAGSRLARLVILFGRELSVLYEIQTLYLALIPACSTVDYVAGLAMQYFNHRLIRRLFLCLSLIVNLSLLIPLRSGTIGSFP